MNSFIKQKQFTDTEKKIIVTKGERREDKLGVWDEHTHTTLNKTQTRTYCRAQGTIFSNL